MKLSLQTSADRARFVKMSAEIPGEPRQLDRRGYKYWEVLAVELRIAGVVAAITRKAWGNRGWAGSARE